MESHFSYKRYASGYCPLIRQKLIKNVKAMIMICCHHESFRKFLNLFLKLHQPLDLLGEHIWKVLDRNFTIFEVSKTSWRFSGFFDIRTCVVAKSNQNLATGYKIWSIRVLIFLGPSLKVTTVAVFWRFFDLFRDVRFGRTFWVRALYSRGKLALCMRFLV